VNHLTPIVLFVLNAIIAQLPTSLSAMDFETTEMDGRKVLLASGPIEIGDAARYRLALLQIPEQPHGAKVVLLDSPGGSVNAAFEMSAVNDDFTVHMVIPDGAICASACASIIYISGDYRTTSTDGRFGQHSCSRAGVPDLDCNEQMATHAFEHGVAHGAVGAFVTYVAPADIFWLSNSDLDCWNISFYPYSQQSGFERLDPCIFEALNGNKPRGQSVWRVDMMADGYRAFARPVSDDNRDFELSLYCDELIPGQLFLDFDIYGPVDEIRSVLMAGYLQLGGNRRVEIPYSMKQVDHGFSRITLDLPKVMVSEILMSPDELGLYFDVTSGFQPISSWVSTNTSREALIFVANHCINRLATR
jgi:hypothetical protein